LSGRDQTAPLWRKRGGRPAFDVLGEVAARAIADAIEQAGVDGTVNVNTRVVHTSRFGVPGSINFEVIVGDEAQLETAEAVLMAAVESLKIAPSASTVSTAQKRLRTDWYRTARDANAIAFEIGHFQTMDRWQTLPVYLEARDDTTPDDLATIAEKYFVPENRSVGVARSKTPRGRPATEEQP